MPFCRTRRNSGYPRFPLLLFAASLLSVLLVWGCATSGRVASLHPFHPAEKDGFSKTVSGPSNTQVPVNGTDDLSAAVDTLSPACEDSTAESACENPEPLLEAAREHCNAGSFAAADSIFRLAIRIIEAFDAENTCEVSLQPASRYFMDIVALYNEKMPSQFPLPEELSMVVFQTQMFRSLDSIKFLPADSLAIEAMACPKGLSYDVPMTWNERVRRALFFYVNNRSSTIDKWFLRAPVFLPIMRKMFADSSLPQDLAYLPLIESGFNPLAYSWAHASGIWQFISSTGKFYGLRHNYWVDDRRDPLKATTAAIRYLKKLHRDFDDWYLALAAYNCGENGLKRSINRNNTRDFWKLKLPNETKNYVPFYLAAVTIAKNPACFSITKSPIQPFDLDTVTCRECINLSDIAEGLAIPLDTLRRINPHITRWCTPPDSVTLYLPPGCRDDFIRLAANIPPEKKIKWCRYQVKPFDNLNKIAVLFNITDSCIMQINRLAEPKVEDGRVLLLPEPQAELTTSVAFIPPEQKDDNESSAMTTYRIRRGDNLGKIARRFKVSIAQIQRLNHMRRSTTLRIGRVLVIRRAPMVSTDPAPVAAAATPLALPKPAITMDTILKIPDSTSIVSDTVPPSVSTMAPIDTLLRTAPPHTDTAPAATSEPGWTEALADSSPPPRFHIIAKGENLFRISLRYRISLDSLLSANGLTRKSVVRPGDKLSIPVPPGAYLEQAPQEKVIQRGSM